jgi:hypothetical protein
LSVSHTHWLKGIIRLKLTIDSTEALEDTLRVVGALYNVTLEVSHKATTSNGSDKATGHATAASVRRTRRTPGRRGSAQRRPVKRRTSERTTSKRAPSRHARASSGSDRRLGTAAVRAWARENGYTVADRGRMPTDVVTAYRNAQPT